MSKAAFEAFVKQELGDVPVMEDGRYISPKIQKYWLTWQAGQQYAQSAIKSHNDECEASCKARGQADKICEAYSSRGRQCPDCPRYYSIEVN